MTDRPPTEARWTPTRFTGWGSAPSPGCQRRDRTRAPAMTRDRTESPRSNNPAARLARRWRRSHDDGHRAASCGARAGQPVGQGVRQGQEVTAAAGRRPDGPAARRPGGPAARASGPCRRWGRSGEDGCGQPPRRIPAAGEPQNSPTDDQSRWFRHPAGSARRASSRAPGDTPRRACTAAQARRDERAAPGDARLREHAVPGGPGAGNTGYRRRSPTKSVTGPGGRAGRRAGPGRGHGPRGHVVTRSASDASRGGMRGRGPGGPAGARAVNRTVGEGRTWAGPTPFQPVVPAGPARRGWPGGAIRAAPSDALVRAAPPRGARIRRLLS